MLLGRVVLVAQRPIANNLSRGRSVGLCVRPSVGPSVRRAVQCIVENGGSDPDAVWHHRPDGSRFEGFGDRSTERGTFGNEFGGAPL